jgi:crossover junction endodeoxyribonuclease RuvC
MNASVRILGLDPSMSSFGVCYPDGRCDTLHPPKTLTILHERYRWFYDSVRNIVADHRPDVVVMERGFSNPNHDVSGTLWGLRKTVVQAASPVPVVLVPPSTLKKAATGSGKATKVQMVARALELGYDVANDDEADAALLAHGFHAGWWS